METRRTAEVTWRGSLTEGEGMIERVTSGVLSSLAVDWRNRAEGGDEKTTPEELIAAAHAACFSMALSAALAKAGTSPERLEASATVTFVPGEGITKSELRVRGTVPGVDEDAFRKAAEGARDACPVSQALAGNVELSVDAALA